MRDRSGTRDLSKHLGAIGVFAIIGIIATLAALDIRVVFEPPLLLAILNTVLISFIFSIVAYISAKSYLAGGSISILTLGCGVLAFGIANLVAGCLVGSPGGPGVSVTIHNTGALFGAVFHLVSAALISMGLTPEGPSKGGKLAVILAYLGVLFVMALLTIASLQGLIPPFFIQKVGATPLRQGVLGTAVLLFAISSLLCVRLYSRSKSDSLYWYSLALALIAIGLSAVFLQKAVGSPIGWAGRCAQYAGGMYLVIAVLTATRHIRAKGIPLERAIADLFRNVDEHYRTLVETVTDAIIATDSGGRILLWNSAAERMFGYTRDEALGSLLIDLIVPDDHADTTGRALDYFAATGRDALVGKRTEMEVKRKDGREFLVELSVSARRTAAGWLGTSVMRDITERKRVQEALRESEERYRALFEQSPIGIGIARPDGAVIAANKAIEAITGYSVEELRKINLADNYENPRDRDALLDTLARDGSVTNYAVRLKRKDGTRYDALFGISRIVVRGKSLLQTVVQDITERKRAEEALRQRTQDLGERVKELNSLYAIGKLVETPGVSLEEILQGTVDLLPSAYQYPEVTCARLCLEDRRFKTQGFRETPWGQASDIRVHGKPVGSVEVFYLEQRPESDEGPFLAGERALIDAVGRRLGRVTQRVRTQQELADANRLLETILDTSPVLTAYLDPQFNFVTVNRAYAEADERDPEFFPGKNHFDLYPNAENEEIFQRVVDTGEAYFAYAKPFEYAEHPERGASYWDWSLVPIKGRGGRVTGLVLSASDVTERIRAEEALRRARDELEMRVQERTAELVQTNKVLRAETEQRKRAEEAEVFETQFISNVSHELRTPLSVISLASGNLDMLYERLEDDKRRQMIRDIREHARVLNDLIGSVLEISRIDSGHVSMQRQRVDLARLAREEVEGQRSLSQKKSHSLRVAGVEQLAVWGNDDQLRRVIRNLLNNAIKYTPDGGRISCQCLAWVSGATAAAAWPGSEGLPVGRWAALRVVDNGLGISPEDLPHIFERFFRVNSQGSIPGTGLGLSIAQELIKLHKGHVAISSTPGEGSIFAVYLPLLEE